MTTTTDLAWLSAFTRERETPTPWTLTLDGVAWTGATNGWSLVMVREPSEHPAPTLTGLPPAVARWLAAPSTEAVDVPALLAWAEQGIADAPPCPECQGAGRLKKCPECHGEKRIDVECDGCDDVHMHACPECKGKGVDVECADCGGRGDAKPRELPGWVGGLAINRRLLTPALAAVQAYRPVTEARMTAVAWTDEHTVIPLLVRTADWLVAVMPLRQVAADAPRFGGT